jgi:hypothetical protein
MSAPTHDELAALNPYLPVELVEKITEDLAVNEDLHGAPLPAETLVPVDTRTAEANLASRSNIVAG